MKRMVVPALVAVLVAVAGPLPASEAAVPGADRTSFTEIGSYGAGGYSDIKLGDLDGDGDLDIVASQFTERLFQVFLNRGDGSFGAGNEYLASPTFGDYSWETNLADLDGDGDLDAVTNGRYELYVRFGNGNGSFGVGIQQEVSGEDAELVDFDGDDDIDIVLVNLFGYDVRVLANQGDGTFELTQYPSSFEPRVLTTTDLNHDGRLDVALVHSPLSTSTTGPGNLVVLASQSGGGYEYERQDPAAQSPGAVDAGDVDGDGNPDIVVLAGDQYYGDDSTELLVYLGNGDGTLGAPTSFPLPTKANAREVVLHDVNGDGNLDAVVASFNNDIRVLEGFGDGTFDAELVFPAPNDSTDLDIGDLDGDGRPDVVFTSILGRFYVYRNTTVADVTAPVTTITRTPTEPTGLGGWDTAPVTVTVAATDDLTGVAQTRCVVDPEGTPPTSFAALPPGCALLGDGISLSTDGEHVVYAASTDVKGNVGAVVSLTVRVDATAPVATLGTDPAGPDGSNGWFRSDVVVVADGSDGPAGSGSGVGQIRCVLDPPVAPLSFADIPEGSTCPAVDVDGVHTAYAAASDVAGNTGTVVSLEIRRDATPPALVVTTPAEGSLLLRGRPVVADYTCTDATSGVVSCVGAVPDGALIDTTRTGTQTFSASVADAAGNTAVAVSTYRVCTGIVLGRCLEGPDLPPPPPRPRPKG